ncbi:MAG: hypothetical protein IJS48_08145 [Prevotella sp.]|nr:hypothetical protein [Prevotella sp.]
MKKILLLLVLVMTAGAVNAKTTKKIALLAAENNATYSENVFTWTSVPSNGGGQRLKLFNNMKGNIDLTVYKYLHIKISDKSNGGWRFVIMCNNNANTAAYTSETKGSTLEVTVDLTTLTLNDGSARTLSEVNGIYVQGQWTAGNFTIKAADCYLETDEYEGNTTPFSSLSTGGTWPNSLVSLPATVSSGLKIVGKDNGVSDYADITDYHAIIFKITDFVTQGGGKIRAFICNDGDGSFTTRYAYPVSNTSVANWSEPNGPSGDGYYYIDVTGYSRLVGIKTNNYSTPSDWKISEVYLVKKNLIIADGFDMADMVNDPFGATVNYDRTFVSDRMSTVCLPFALTTSETSAAGKFYELIKVDDKGLHFTEVTETEAYKPYVFNPTATTPFASLTNKAIVATPASESDYAITVDGYTFQGVLAHQSLPSGVYGYNAANGVFSKTTSEKVTIDAFRAYITGPSLARSLNCIFSDDETTGIQTLSSIEKENGTIYNLAGQRVSANHKGIVIHNGKKVIVK